MFATITRTMLSLLLAGACVAGAAGCGSAGSGSLMPTISASSAPDCIPPQAWCSVYPPPPIVSATPFPTASPQRCVSSVLLLYPRASTTSSYAGPIYVSLPRSEKNRASLGIELRFVARGGGSASKSELGILRAAVDVPPYVPAPPNGYAGVFTAGDALIGSNIDVEVDVVDTNTASRLAPVVAGIFRTASAP